MHRPSFRSAGATVALAGMLSLGLAGCGGSAPSQGGSQTDGQGSSQGASQGSDGSQTPTQTPTPEPKPTDLKPGTNHSYAAAAYAHDARKVQEWMLKGDKARKLPAQKTVFLTFDDGPNDGITPKILDILKAKKVPATFFYVGNDDALAQANPKVVHRAVADGHAIAIHSFSHDYHYLYPGRRADAEHIGSDLDKMFVAVRKVLGPEYDTHAFRYPGGHMSWKDLEASDKMLADRGMAWLDWNALTGDAEPASRRPGSPAGAVKFLRQNMDSNDKVVVVLMHDAWGKNITVKALPAVIDMFREQGYQFAVLS